MLIINIVTKILLMFQLTKVGLPVNVVNGVNPLSNGMINPTGNKAGTAILPDLKRNFQILLLPLSQLSVVPSTQCLKNAREGGRGGKYGIFHIYLSRVEDCEGGGG